MTQLILCSWDNFHISNVTRKVHVLQEEATTKLVVIGRSSCTKHVRSLNLVIATFCAACSLYAGLDPCKCPTWRRWHFAICSAQRPLSRATGSISYNYMCGKPGWTPFCWAAADRQKALPRAKQCWYIFERHPHHIATLQTPQHLRNMDVSLTRATPTPSVSLQYIKIY